MDPRRSRAPAGPPEPSGTASGWPSLFLRQPPRVLIVEALPPWWAQTGPVICQALDNFLSLACSVAGPCRVPLFSLYAVGSRQECLLPFVTLGGNLARLRCSVEELRGLQGDGCVRTPPAGGGGRGGGGGGGGSGGGGGGLLRQAVLGSLQQFRQYSRHMTDAGRRRQHTSLEVTVVTSQPGQVVVQQLVAGLRGAQLSALRRLLVLEVSTAVRGWSDCCSPDDKCSVEDETQMLEMEMDLQRVDNSTVAVETVLKSWLQAQGGDREHLDLFLPGAGDGAGPVCLRCDVQERLLSPSLLPLSLNIGPKMESSADLPPPGRGWANQSSLPQRLIAVRTLGVDGVCESVLYGLPMVVRPTPCWALDWEDLKRNNNLFHALCHTLRSRELFLLVKSDGDRSPLAPISAVQSLYVLQASPSLSLLMKPVICRELLLPCPLPVCTQDLQPDALLIVQSSLAQLEEDSVFNPLSVSSNLYQHLRSRAMLSRPMYPYKLPTPAGRRDRPPPPDGAHEPNAGQPRQQGHHTLRPPPTPPTKARAAVDPLPRDQAPPLFKVSRPALTFHSGPASPGGPRASPRIAAARETRGSLAPLAEAEEEEEEVVVVMEDVFMAS